MPRLNDQEQQEIIRHLEADKPLPDKYRFLLFEDKREVELVWNGKTNTVCNIVLPFQSIELVDEPRAEKTSDTSLQLDLFDERGRQRKGWTNKLIWGDNKLILSALKNGPLREGIEAQGGLKLIYIDPPFDVGADFSMDIEIGGDTFTKKPNILEEIAYRDTWGKGADSFIAMIYERLILMRDLLAEDGSIYVHCDWRVNSFIRLALDEIFGPLGFGNEISWKRKTGSSSQIGSTTDRYGHDIDLLLFFKKGERTIFNMQYTASDPEYIKKFYRHQDSDGRIYRIADLANPAPRPTLQYEYKGYKPPKNGWAISKVKMEQWDKEDRLYFPKSKDGRIQRKRYLDELKGKPVSDFWDDIGQVASQSHERVGYPTQKPEALLERIIKASSNGEDLVADFFCGSGTTGAVAEKLGRKWIATDLGKFAIHTTRKRMIGVQRQRKADGEDYRAFEILNLGKYERQHYIGVNPNLREEEQQQQLKEKEAAFIDLIIRAYAAEKIDNFAAFQGLKAGRLVAVGPVNLPVTRLFIEELILECRKHHITRVDVLGFEFEMGLFPNLLDEAKGKGIDLAAKYIPAEVFDKRAVERNQVVFHDVAFIEVKPIISYPPDKGGKGGYVPYNKALTEKARENRNNPTPTEQKLWYEVLQNKRLGNLKFTRQKPLGEYIVDFHCAELMLAIEIDGDTHTGQEQYDKHRTENLNRYGIDVIRYTNAEILNTLEGVYQDLRKRISARKASNPPCPPYQGGYATSSGGLPTVAVELTNFSVFYSQDANTDAEQRLKNKGSRIIVDKGQIVKVSRDANGVFSSEVLTRSWTD